MITETEAWHWQLSANPDDLILQNMAIPSLKEDQVLIENHAIGINPVDWKLMAGLSDSWQKNQIPGVDGMGVVVAVGSNAQHIQLGTRYTYHTDLRFNGSFSRHTIVSAKALIAVPDQISNVTAAAFPCPALTAWQASHKTPNPQAENVLVNGAGGAVGSILTQLLIDTGAKVYITASPAHHKKFINKGVISAFDYRDTNWQSKLRAQLGSQNIFSIYDTVNGNSAKSLADLLGYYGHLVCIQDRIEQAPLPPFTTSISLHEIALASIHVYGTDKQWSKLVAAGEQLLLKIARKELTLPPIEVISFANLPKALNLLKQQNNGIKYVATVNN
ncbi:zinc-binding dehydrogenase [Entomomonas asaccharolytica]|uniref:Zinc-binding dehydrogenase n=1 Tax=Entomomonas asaccharolytica TaxID=2785331 RepID=A0A974NHE4_9GAMM|nr:zinc-binding dehydrogenase [Entomomonas asaccharolytica]QQP86635.1 zinc-binding dehydrogenase [Entomomonas asaccharolytica]